MSFVKKLQSQSGAKEIFYVWAPDTTGRDAWWYVKVPTPKHRMFENALKGPCDLAEYGEIITSGYGKKSPDSVRQRMKEEYGFEHSNS